MDQARDGLDQAGVGIGFHAPSKFDDCLGLEQAIGVEHQQIIVGTAPAPAEIGDVAGFAGEVPVSSAII